MNIVIMRLPATYHQACSPLHVLVHLLDYQVLLIMRTHHTASLFHLFCVLFGVIIEWLSEYHSARPDPEKLQAAVDRFMDAFDTRTAEVYHIHTIHRSFIA